MGQCIIVLAMSLNSMIGQASNFGWHSDAMRGGDAACIHREIRPTDIGVASRDLPCGSRIVITNIRTGLSTNAIVIDHGPYGAVYKGRWVLKRRETDRGEWRGILDLSLGAARRIQHNGFEPVFFYVVRRGWRKK